MIKATKPKTKTNDAITVTHCVAVAFFVSLNTALKASTNQFDLVSTGLVSSITSNVNAPL